MAQASLAPGSMEIAQRLQNVVVTGATADGQSLRLGDLWRPDAPGPVLICMFRRWGCGLCRMSAVQVSSLKPYLDPLNVQLIGLGVERVGVEEFIEGNFFAGQLYLDENRQSYAALSCGKTSWKNLWGLLSDEISRLAPLMKRRGFANNFQGDKNQLGGTFLLAPGGALLYGHYQTSTSFEPDLKGLTKALGIELPANFDPYEVTAPNATATRN
jgi:prostamide/prostaglandin F2alpha synthase